MQPVRRLLDRLERIAASQRAFRDGSVEESGPDRGHTGGILRNFL